MSELKVFGSDLCGACVKTKEFLEEKDADFEFKDVVQDEENAEELAEEVENCNELDGCEFTPEKRLSIPMVVTEDEVIIGFDKNKLEDKLA